MSEIQQNRYDQLLRRVCNLVGPGSKVSWSVGDLLPVLDVEDPPLELHVLMGSRVCLGRIEVAAGGAGNFSQVILNAPASGAIARVVCLFIRQVGFARDVFFGSTQQAAGPLAGSSAFADGRVFGQGTTYKVTGFNNLLATGGGFFGIHVPADGILFQPPHGIAVATPEAGFQVSSETANTPLDVSLLWIERVAQQSELNL